MGDRGNIVVHDGFFKDAAPVYLYTHWSGYRIKDILQKALSRRLRWNDSPYLTRIIFCEMVSGDVDGETGYGISTVLGDNEHNILHVHPANGTVEERTEKGKLVKRWTFDEFIKAEFKEDED
jgi:hypothetical protein